jgi:hypothetical protein
MAEECLEPPLIAEVNRIGDIRGKAKAVELS